MESSLERAWWWRDLRLGDLELLRDSLIAVCEWIVEMNGGAYSLLPERAKDPNA